MSVSKKIGPSSASWGSFIFVGITLCWASQVALVVKNPPANEGDVRDTGLIPGLKRSLGRGHHNLLQYCLKNPMDRRSLVDYSPWGCRVRHDWHDLECTHSWLKMGKNKLIQLHRNLGKIATIQQGSWLYIKGSRLPISGKEKGTLCFSDGLDGKESACNSGDLGSNPGLGRSPGGEHGNTLQYSCLENPMDRRASWATVHRVTKSRPQLSYNSFTFLSNLIPCNKNLGSEFIWVLILEKSFAC